MSGLDIGAWQDFPDRELTSIEVSGMKIGVCRWGERIYAFRSTCPHEGASLCSGFLQQTLTGEIRRDGVDVGTDPEAPVVMCPWHRWEFRLDDGSAAWPGYRMRTYRVTREDDRVVLWTGRK